LEKYTRKLQEDDNSITDETAAEHFFAYKYLVNADKNKYGSLLDDLRSQYSRGTDQFPRTLEGATNLLSEHKLDNGKQQSQQQNNNQRQHQKKEDKSEDDTPTWSFAQMEGKCYCCGKPGHKSPDCRFKDKIPKEEWAIRKAEKAENQQHTQVNNDGATEQTDQKDNKQQARKVGWSALQYTFSQFQDMKEMILLDSDSTDSIMCNPEYVKNIRESSKNLTITTNGGQMETTQKCDIEWIGEVWYNPNAVTNILSLAHVASMYRVTMDTAQEKALIVHVEEGEVRTITEWIIWT